MIVKLLTEHHLEFLSLKGDCTTSSEFTMSKCHIVGNHMLRINYLRLTQMHHPLNTYMRLHLVRGL